MPPTDQGRGEEEKGAVAGLGFLEADQDFTEAIEPGVGSLHDPATGSMPWMVKLRFRFLAARFQPEPIVVLVAGQPSRLATISGIHAEVWSLARVRLRVDDVLEGGLQQFGVMHVGPADDERQRDATPVDQKASFASLFSPDR